MRLSQKAPPPDIYSRPDRASSLLSLALPGIGFFIGMQAILTTTGWFTGFGEFSGPDPYMRLVRVLECRGGLACPDGVLTLSNTPFGEVLHWPFLLDRLIALLAAPFLLFTDLRTATILGGYLVGPLLGVGAMVTLTALARVVLVDHAARWVPVLASVHYWVLYAFAPVRPDHHGLQTLLFLIALLGVIRILGASESIRGGWIAGIGVGLAIWVSTEGLVSVAPLLIALALFWVATGGSAVTGGSARLWATAAAVLGLGLLLDGPTPDRWAIEFDRFSVVHFFAFFLGALFWSAVVIRTPRGLGGRLVLLTAASGIAAWALAMVYPGVEKGPFSGVDPELWTLFLAHVHEFTPLTRLSREAWGWIAAGPGLVGLSLVCVLLAGWKNEGTTWWGVRKQTGSSGWTILAVALTWFLALSIFGQVRWTHYIHILAPVALAAALVRILGGVNQWEVPALARAAGKLAVGSLFIVWPMFFLALPVGREQAESKRGGCGADPLVTELGRTEAAVGRRRAVLAPVFWGPELIFRSNVEVVAGPYHRNAHGIMDSYRVMAATDSDVARRVLEERGVDLVALCTKDDWMPLVPADSAGTLYNDLVEGRPPPWLRSVPLPSAPDHYRLFEVLKAPTAGEGQE